MAAVRSLLEPCAVHCIALHCVWVTDDIQVSPSNGTVSAVYVRTINAPPSTDNNYYQAASFQYFKDSCSTGQLTTTRWRVETNGGASDLDSQQDFEWYVDGHWQHVYTHDDSGQALDGSLAQLLAMLAAGRPIRLVLMEASPIVLQPDWVVISGSHVNAFKIWRVRRDSICSLTNANDDYEWLTVTSTGAVRRVWRHLGDPAGSPQTVSSSTVRWFADSRPWARAASVAAGGGLLDGSTTPTALASAVQKAAAVRCEVTDGGLTGYYQPGYLSVDVGTGHVAAEYVTLSHSLDPGALPAGTEMMVDLPAMWLFNMVSTLGAVRTESWQFGTRAPGTPDVRPVAIDWFVRY